MTEEIEASKILNYTGGQLTLDDLMGKVEPSLLVKSKTTEVPLHQIDQDKIERIVAYKKVKKDISEWQPLVNYNRKSKVLDLPFQKEKGNNVTIASLAIDLKAENDFEQQVLGLQTQTGMTEKQISEREEQFINNITEEEVRERIRELRRLRELSFRYDTKMKRHKKIKSRKYRQILGKEKMRKSVKNLSIAELQELSGVAATDEIEELSFKRAEERLTLRHKDLGKWSKMIKKRGNKDPITRKAIAEQLQKHEELKRKMSGEEEIIELQKQSDAIELSKPSKMDDLMDLDFMKNELPVNNSDSEEDMSMSVHSDEELEEMRAPVQIEENTVDATNILTNLNSQFHFQVPTDVNVFTNKANRVVAQVVDGVEINNVDSFQQFQINNEEDTDQSEQSDASSDLEQAVSTDNPWTTGIQEYTEQSETFEIKETAEFEISKDQLDLVKEAFEEDGAIAAFRKEKEALEEEEGDKVEDVTLPGWGCWGGLNAKPARQNIKIKTTKGISKEKRADKKRETVIIREKQKTKMMEKYLVKKTPYPFKTQKEYESALSHPNGKEWNTHHNYAKVNKPRIQTMLGKVIMPLLKSAKNSMTHDKEAAQADLMSSDSE